MYVRIFIFLFILTSNIIKNEINIEIYTIRVFSKIIAGIFIIKLIPNKYIIILEVLLEDKFK